MQECTEHMDSCDNGLPLRTQDYFGLDSRKTPCIPRSLSLEANRLGHRLYFEIRELMFGSR